MFFTDDTEAAAKKLFAASVSYGYMSKTIRAFELLAESELKINLRINVLPWDPEKITSRAIWQWIAEWPCMLMLIREKSRPNFYSATIKIHPKASRCLVKFAIVHELEHLRILLAQLHKAQEEGKDWTPPHGMTAASDADEPKCNLFATHVCKSIHKVNSDKDLAKRFKLFPESFINARVEPTIREYLASIPEFHVKEEKDFLTLTPYSEIFKRRD